MQDRHGRYRLFIVCGLFTGPSTTSTTRPIYPLIRQALVRGRTKIVFRKNNMTEFEGVVPALVQALSKRGYSVLTPVQKAVLAPELRDADALVSAQTGSGKTVAFGLALAPTLLGGEDRFGHAPVPLALVVAPTRELALQVKRELDWLYEMTGAEVASCVGGMDMRTERRALERGAHIVVGTPGRLCDHIKRGSFNTTGLKAVVLDEADEMLDLGFREELETILDAAPTDRRTLMFSATVPRSIATLAKRYQRDAVRVAASGEEKQHLDIEYRALTVPSYERENAIINVLRFYEAKNSLVFCATRATVNHMTSRLNNRGFSVVALSGELSQNERTHALQAMRDGRARVCVATDVAARGIDLPNLELVIHADVPKNAEGLLHRSGRTGRAGRKGVSVLMVPNNARKKTDRLLENANVRATWARAPSVDEILARDRERILADPALSEAISDEERPFVEEILARHTPEMIAAAFLRQNSAGRTAPEELQDAPPPEQTSDWSPTKPGARVRDRSIERKPKQSRDDFKDGVWFSLSVGLKNGAEPRWLLPMLCRAGDISNTDIGAIRIHQNETHVEIAPASVEKFLAAIGPDHIVEKTVALTRIDGIPAAPAEPAPQKSRDKPYEKKPYEKKSYEKKPYEKKATDEKKPYEKKPYEKKATDEKKPYEKKPYEKKPYEKKPYEKKPYEKKPYDKKPADEQKSGAYVKSGEKRKFDKKPDDAPSGDRPRVKKWEKRTDTSKDDPQTKKWAKPGDKTGGNAKGKKPYKSAFKAKTGTKASTEGITPLQRKKLKKLHLK